MLLHLAKVYLLTTQINAPTAETTVHKDVGALLFRHAGESFHGAGVLLHTLGN